MFSKVLYTKSWNNRFQGIDWWKKIFDEPINNKEETYEKNIEMSKSNDHTTGNLLDYEYFSKHHKLIAIYLSKQIQLEKSDLKQ